MTTEPVPRQHRLRALWWALGIIATVLVVAVGAVAIWLSNALKTPQETPMQPDQIAALTEELRTRGSAEDTLTRYEQLLASTADQIIALVPELGWRWNRDSTTISCGGDLKDTDGVQILTRHILFDGPIPDSAWPGALSAVRKSAAALGASDVTVFADRPSDHSVELTGKTGVQMRFATKVAATLSARSDCHLQRADF